MKPEIPTNRQQLLSLLAQEETFKYVFFWGHTPGEKRVGASCMSQWYDVGFELEGVHYKSAEHYMMAEKARLFGDHEIREAILEAPHPGAAKKLGRKVKGFKEQEWFKHRFEIVVRGNLAKFSQNEELREYLIGTGTRILVEASPHDKIWGIGMDKHDPHATQPHEWKGQNLLGFALMVVRENLSI